MTAIRALSTSPEAAPTRNGAPQAPPERWRRRVTYDLTGLPPTAEETDAFLADSTPDAFARLVDRLLASPHYGEHWGRHWLDVVRYADTGGYHSDNHRDVWLYRDYVIGAFNENKPFDQFVDAVAEGRKMKREEVLRLADGRIFTGAQASKLGLIDKLGNLQDAIDIAAGLVGIEGEPQVVYPRKERRSILDFIFEEVAASVARVVESALRGALTGAYVTPAG